MQCQIIQVQDCCHRTTEQFELNRRMSLQDFLKSGDKLTQLYRSWKWKQCFDQIYRSKYSSQDKQFLFFEKLSVEKGHWTLGMLKTGEGKSIILGAMSILFALMGHKVDCVSYSEYLSKRDQDFKSMFEQLGVSDRIEYGTFRSLAQKLINQGHDIRQLALSYFQTDQNILNKNQQNKVSRILLVDEVDTFFSKDFYGVTYNPITILPKPEIISIINIIWRDRSNDLQRVTAIYKQSQHYKKLSTQYSDCIQYFDNHFL